MSVIPLREIMQNLKLKDMLASLHQTLETAQNQEGTLLVASDGLLQDERGFRNRQRIRIRIKISRPRASVACEDYEFPAKLSLTKAQLKKIISLIGRNRVDLSF